MYSGEHKIIKNNSAMILKITWKDRGEDMELSMEAKKPYQDGVYCFNTYKLKPPEFSVATDYTFEFLSETPGVRPKAYILRVVPGDPVKLICDLSKIEVALGVNVQDIEILQADKYDNKVDFPKEMKDFSDLKILTSTKSIQIKNYNCKISETKSLIIEDLIFEEGDSMEDSNREKLYIEIVYKNFSPLRIPLIICPGIPHTIDFTDETKQILNERKPVRRVLPTIKLAAYDKYKNRIMKSVGAGDLVCTAESNALLDTCEVPLNSDGLFVFESLKLKDVSQPCSVKIRFMIEDTECNVTCEFSVDPSVIRPSQIRLCAPPNQEDFIKSVHSQEALVTVVVGSELVNWKLEFLNGIQFMI